MYTSINFKTKKQFREAVARGDSVTVYQPGPFGNDPQTRDGTCAIEGPHYPQPHSWYATAELRGGLVVKVR